MRKKKEKRKKKRRKYVQEIFCQSIAPDPFVRWLKINFDKTFCSRVDVDWTIVGSVQVVEVRLSNFLAGVRYISDIKNNKITQKPRNYSSNSVPLFSLKVKPLLNFFFFFLETNDSTDWRPTSWRHARSIFSNITTATEPFIITTRITLLVYTKEFYFGLAPIFLLFIFTNYSPSSIRLVFGKLLEKRKCFLVLATNNQRF